MNEAPTVIKRLSDPFKFCRIIETGAGDQVLFVKARSPQGRPQIHISTHIDKFGVVALTFDFPDVKTRDERFEGSGENDATEARRILFSRCLTHGKPVNETDARRDS